MNILVVEDDLEMARLLVRGLREESHEVEVAHDGVSALRLAENGRFDLTLVPGTVGLNPGNFDLVEKVSAGYVMDTIDFNHIRVVGGVRFEGTNLDTFTPSFDSNNNFMGNTAMSGSYLKVLPSASVRFDLGHDTDVRVVYSRALSRPDPQDIA
jgi:outer membrane receptor protein involved in Fe transport